jgi:hypothetical protein
MDCKIIECTSHIDCSILDILGIEKQPKDAKSCSYFKKYKVEKVVEQSIKQLIKRKKNVK